MTIVVDRVVSALRGRGLWHEASPRAARMPAPILIYHAVTRSESDDPYVLTERRFREHVEVLAASRLATVRVSDIARSVRTADAIALTFDDGCVSWLDCVAPMLAAHDLPATFFVIADRLSEPRGSVASQEPLTWAAIRALAEMRSSTDEQLFEIGSHGLHHVDLARRLDEVGADALREELRQARETIEDHVGQACRALSLPGGKSGRDESVGRQVRAIAGEAGYELVRDSRPRYDRCPHTDFLGGSPVYANTTAEMLRFELLRVRRGNWNNAARWIWMRGRGRWIERQDRATPQLAARRDSARVAARPHDSTPNETIESAPRRLLRLTWHVPRLMQHGCGMSRRVRDLAAALQRRGHAVRWVVPADATDVRGACIDGIAVQRVETPASRSPHWSLQARQRVRRAEVVADAIGDVGDIVLTCQPEFAAALRALRPELPIVLVACCAQLLYEPEDRAESAGHRLPHRTARALNRGLLRHAERRGFRAASAIAFDSAMTRDLVARTYELPAERCHVVSPTVDVRRFTPASDESRRLARRDLALPESGFVVCWTGRMEDRKNVAMLLDAAALARDAIDRVLLVGDGADRTLLEARAADLGLSGVARFEGMQPRVEAYLHAADAFVLPSLVESFGISLIEAMACGLPCVGLGGTEGAIRSNAGELIEEGRTGFVLTTPSPALLAERLRTLAADPDLRWRMGAAARARVESDHAAGTDGPRLERILEQLVHTERGCEKLIVFQSRDRKRAGGRDLQSPLPNGRGSERNGRGSEKAARTRFERTDSQHAR